jgi:hypothetical protein
MHHEEKWIFKPEYADSPLDTLPEDTWIGFLQEQVGTTSTGPNTRPFNLSEREEFSKLVLASPVRRGPQPSCRKVSQTLTFIHVSGIQRILTAWWDK